uniref:Uncharacterized protein n=1 Tax=Pipistrellus kuhlii TaxID=59472 RepID=A0A7J7SW62_PIPKU|nr:hypothetical protein mPipKuh1_009757 [Pipistrellus kuhlii]
MYLDLNLPCYSYFIGSLFLFTLLLSSLEIIMYLYTRGPMHEIHTRGSALTPWLHPESHTEGHPDGHSAIQSNEPISSLLYRILVFSLISLLIYYSFNDIFEIKMCFLDLCSGFQLYLLGCVFFL